MLSFQERNEPTTGAASLQIEDRRKSRQHQLAGVGAATEAVLDARAVVVTAVTVSTRTGVGNATKKY